MPAALTVPEVAEALRVSEWTVRQAIRNGELARIPHTGRLVRITPAAVEACFGVTIGDAA
jgi:excisionase family DNA binding protein